MVQRPPETGSAADVRTGRRRTRSGSRVVRHRALFLIWYRYWSALQIAGSFLIGCAEQFQDVERKLVWVPVLSVLSM